MGTDAAERIERALTGDAVADRVEMVARRTGEDSYRAAAVDGTVEFRRGRGDDGWSYEVTGGGGRNPIGDQDPDRFGSRADEVAGGPPDRASNAYPYAYEQLAQFFDAPVAPDLVVQHTAAHHFDDHIGQHGSLGVVQARAPFVAAGAGIGNHGWIAGHARMVDLAPTIGAALGCGHADGIGPDGTTRTDLFLRRQDGAPIATVLDGDRAQHVVVFLLDGTNANALRAAIDEGDAPTIGTLVTRGTALDSGLLASFPTATLANHTTANTGAHPGHSGVLHNSWFDRAHGARPDLLAADQLFTTMRHLSPDVDTVHTMVHRRFPDAYTAATMEYCDTGADFSSFADIAARRPGYFPRKGDAIPHQDPEWAAASGQYDFMSRVDHASRSHAIDQWRPDGAHPLPTYCFVNFSLTDEASHEGGPHSAIARAAIRESDARIAEVLTAIDDSGVLDRTAVFIIADHGMETNDPDNNASWEAILAAVGVPVRDVAGLLYLT